MANTLLTPTWLTKEMVSMFVNSNAFLQQIDRQYDREFQRDFKIGDQLQIRQPVSYVVGNSMTVNPQATVETFTTMTVGQIKNIATSWTDTDFTLYIDDFRKRYLDQMCDTLAANVASDVMSMVDASQTNTGVGNFVGNFSGNTLISPTATTWLAAGRRLDELSADRLDRQATLSPKTQQSTVTSLTGLFNPTVEISDQYRKGIMGGTDAFGIRGWRLDQSVIVHTQGNAGVTTVSAGSQSGAAITINASNGQINAGDIITFNGGQNGNPVMAVNRLMGQPTFPFQAVVTSKVSPGGTVMNIFPALTPLAGNATAQYMTCDVSPSANSTVSFNVPANTQYYKNLVYKPEAFTLVCADLPIVRDGVVACARERYDGISMRYLRYYNGPTASYGDRLDILYGYTMPKQDWAVVVGDSLL